MCNDITKKNLFCNNVISSFKNYVCLLFFVTELRTTQQGQVYFYHIPTGASTWHDPRIPRDLPTNPAELSNEVLGPLPPGW